MMGGMAVAALIAAPVLAKAPPAPVGAPNGPQADFPMTVGAPYQIGGVTFVPSDSMNFDSVGYASVGTEGGTRIAAAHHTLPVPSYAEVTDIRTGRTILVRVDRRGPMDTTHAIELSPGAAAQLGIAGDGKAPVRVRRVNPPEAERALLRAGQPAPERMATPKPLLDVLQRKLNPALAQRTLDSADDDSAPAKAPAPKPVALPPKPTAQPGVDKKPPLPAVALAAPPKGYVPSVPAPAAKPPVAKPSEAKTPALKAKPTPDMPAAAKPAATPKPAPAPGPAAGAFIVQAGAFSDKARAQAVADKIGGTVSQAGKMWRVRVGPYAGHGSAEAALAKVKSAGYSDARIQRAE